MVKGMNDVQWHPAVTVPFQVVGELGGRKEKPICEGLRGSVVKEVGWFLSGNQTRAECGPEKRGHSKMEENTF